MAFDFDSFTTKNVLPNAHVLDSDPHEVKRHIRDLLTGLKSVKTDLLVLPTLEQLEKLFASSTALAFTLSQHISAVERLKESETWQDTNGELWQKIAQAEILCGLATTNLSKPGGAGIQAKETSDKFVLNGTAPWVCGYGLFEKLVVGFEAQDSVLFALIDSPYPDRPSERMSAILHKLAALNGSATYQLKFSEKEIAQSAIISRRQKTGAKSMPRPSAFVIPELGMAMGAIEAIRKIAMNSDHPRQQFVKDALHALDKRLSDIRKKRNENTPPVELIPLRDELIRDANRLLVLATGAQALKAGSLASRLHLEFLLMDAVIQSPEVIARKAQLTGAEKVI